MTSEKKEKKTVKDERILPFYNLSFEKQIDIVKAYVAFYDKNEKTVHYKDIAPIAGVHHTQVSGCRKFWRSIGILEEKDGEDIPKQVALDFVKKLEWGKENEAWQLFRKHIAGAWFVDHVSMALRLQKTMIEDELINSLGSAAGKHRKDPHVVNSLRVLLELLVHSAVIERDEKTEEFSLHPELIKGTRPEPLELSEDEENLLLTKIGDERYVVSADEFMSFVKNHGKKVSSKEYTLRAR